MDDKLWHIDESGAVDLIPLKIVEISRDRVSTIDNMVVSLAAMERGRFLAFTGEERLFHILIPSDKIPIFDVALKLHHRQKLDYPEMSHFYEMMTESKLMAVRFFKGRYEWKSLVYYRGKWGEEAYFKMSISMGLLAAITHRLTILLDAELYDQYAVEKSFSPSEITGMIIKKQTTFDELRNLIARGELPNEELSPMLSELDDKSRDILTDLAVHFENYEWAALLKKIKSESEDE